MRVATRDYLRGAYQKTTQWAAQGGGPLRIVELYLWTLASWDVLGVHHSSYDSTWTASYRDDVVAQRVATHNSRLTGISAPLDRFPLAKEKWNNDGSMTCEDYCKSPTVGDVMYGSCHKAYDEGTKKSMSCSTYRGKTGSQLVCYCKSPREPPPAARLKPPLWRFGSARGSAQMLIGRASDAALTQAVSALLIPCRAEESGPGRQHIVQRVLQQQNLWRLRHPDLQRRLRHPEQHADPMRDGQGQGIQAGALPVRLRCAMWHR